MIHTVKSLQNTARKLNRRNSKTARLNQDADTPAELMRVHGAALHKSYRRGIVRWELSIGRPIAAEVAAVVITRRDIVGVGDGLFGRESSQTWRWVER